MVPTRLGKWTLRSYLHIRGHVVVRLADHVFIRHTREVLYPARWRPLVRLQPTSRKRSGQARTPRLLQPGTASYHVLSYLGRRWRNFLGTAEDEAYPPFVVWMGDTEGGV